MSSIIKTAVPYTIIYVCFFYLYFQTNNKCLSTGSYLKKLSINK